MTFLLHSILCFALFHQTTSTNVFYLHGLFPEDSRDLEIRVSLGEYTRAAAEMAVEHINQMHEVLSDYRLELVPYLSGCEEANGVHGLLEILHYVKGSYFNSSFDSSSEDVIFTSRDISSLPIIILGPACNKPAVLTAALTSRYLNLVQMSYASDTPQLSDVHEYPLFYRTVPSYSTFQDTIYALMVDFDWLHVGIIHEVIPYYTLALESFSESISQSQLDTRVIITQALDIHLTLARTEGARVFIAMVPEDSAAEMLCAAYRMGTTGPSFQWILLGDFEDGWWRDFKREASIFLKVNCTQEEMLQAVESTLILTHHLQTTSKEIVTVSGRTIEQFWVEFASFINTSRGEEFHFDKAYQVPTAYDAVWSTALALNDTLSSSQSETNVTEWERNFTAAFNSALERVNFTGVSGSIRFSSHSHSQSTPTTIIAQMQAGVMVPVGIHYPEANVLNLSYFENSFVWQGKGPPRDRPTIHLQSVNIWIVVAILCLTAIGIIFAVAMLAVNLYFRKHKVIKASSPYINTIIIAGCVMGFSSIIFISFESIDIHQYISPAAYPFLCNIRPWLLSCGFTLAFGALFAKTWRVYVIFRNPWKKKRPYKDHVLIAMVGGLLSIDVIILVLWAILDPLVLANVTLDIDLETFTQEVHVVCSPNGRLDTQFAIWIIVLSIPKAFLLMFGTFLVTQTKKIKVAVFRDAKYTGIAIYGVVIACATGVPTAFISIFFYEEDLVYSDSTTTILGCCYLILIMVFIPKLYLLWRYRHKVPTAVLLGLNPSFRVRVRRHQFTKRQLQSANTLDTTCSATSSRVQLCRIERQEDDTLDTLEGWETADEADSSDELLEDHEVPIKFGDVSYVAYVSCATNTSIDGDSHSTERSSSTNCMTQNGGEVISGHDQNSEGDEGNSLTPTSAESVRPHTTVVAVMSQ